MGGVGDGVELDHQTRERSVARRDERLALGDRLAEVRVLTETLGEDVVLAQPDE